MLLPGLASATSPDATSSPLRASSRNRRFILEVDAESVTEKPPSTRTTPGPDGGSVEVTSRADEEFQVVTTRTRDAKGHLVALSLEVSPSEPDHAELRLLNARARKGAPPLWKAELDFIPGLVLVADTGRYVAILGYRNAPGRGPSDVVLFGPGGKVLWRRSVNDFLSKEERARLPPDAPEIMFGGFGLPEHHFDERRGHLVLRFLADGFADQGGTRLEKRLALDTGKVQP